VGIRISCKWNNANVILLQLQVIILRNNYIYIYKQRSHVRKHKVLPNGTFYVKIIEIFSSITLKIKIN